MPAKGGIALKHIQDAVSIINGFTLYRIRGLNEGGRPPSVSPSRRWKRKRIGK